MNKGKQKKTVEKYRQYILELIKTHNLHPPFKGQGICFKDKVLQEKYHIHTPNGYRYFISNCIELGWLIDFHDYFHMNTKAKYYYLSNEFLADNKLLVNRVINNINNNISLNLIKVELEQVIDQKIEQLQQKEEDRLMTTTRFGKVRIPVEYDDETIKAILYKKYPQILDYKLLALEINAKIHDYYQIKFEPKITRANKYIVKIGIRATNPICLKHTIKKHPEYEYKFSREYSLDNIFGKDNWEEYDIKGSVPRISRLVNFGEWEDSLIDPYEVMYHDWCVDNFGEWNKRTRDLMKQYFMYLYFDGSEKQIIKDLKNAHGELWDGAEQTITQWKKLTEDYCGTVDGTSVFLHESCIYMDVYNELINRGIDTVQVYDAFYTAKGNMPKDIAAIIANKAISYSNRYL